MADAIAQMRNLGAMGYQCLTFIDSGRFPPLDAGPRNDVFGIATETELQESLLSEDKEDG